MKFDAEQVQHILDAATAVIRSADDTGCTDDLTVVSKRAVEELEKAIHNPALYLNATTN
jgi:hypothetical protein